MAKDIRLQVVAVNKASPEFRKLEQDINRVKNRLDETGKRGASSLGRYRSEIKQSRKETSKFAENAKSGFLSLNSSVLKTVGAIGTLTAALAAVGNAISASVETAAKFEFLRVRLENMYNSVEKGREAFEKFNQIAATTPFTLDKVVEAGATLKAFMGDVFNPQYLKIAADLAAFMGTDIVEAASAMGRAFAAGAGAADILRERGILNLIKTRQNIEDFSKITLEEFREAMFRTFTDPEAGIVGATSKLAETVVGLESNLSDAFTRLQNAVGEKFAPAYKSTLKTMIKVTNAFVDTFTDLGAKVEMTAQKAIKSFSDLNKISDLTNVIEQIQELQKLLIKTGDLNQIQYLAQQFQFLTQEEKFAIESAENVWEAISVLGSAVQRFQDTLDDKKVQEYTKSLDLLGKGLAVLDLKTGNVTQTMTQTEQTISRFGLSIKNIKIAEGVIESYEKLNQKLDELKTKATIELNVKGEIGVETLNELEKVQEQLNQLKPLYIKAKIIVDKPIDITPPPIEDITEDTFEKMRQNSDAIWQEQVERALKGAQDMAQTWARGLEAMSEIEQMVSQNQWEWEKNFRLQQFQEKWNLLTKEQKKLLGGEAYYQQARLKIIRDAEREHLQAILSTSSMALRGFASVLQAFSDMSGEQVEAVKVLMAVQALIDAYAAINRAFATLPTPVAIVASVGIAASTFANVMKIESQTVPKPKITPKTPNVNLPPAQTGFKGAVTLAGGGVVYTNPITGADTIPALLSPGEAVISRRIVSQYRPEVERMITGEPSPQPVSVQITPMININAVDSQSVADFVESVEFRDALADAIEDGLLRLRVGNIPVEVER